MKHSLIFLAVTAAIAATSAHAAPKLYGKLNLTAESYTKDFETAPATGDEDYTRLQSNASRFGVKGDDELTRELSAIYGIEWHVRADGDTGTDLSERNRYLGIRSKTYGTVRLGKLDTFLKTSQGEIDLFNDYAGDIEWTVGGENRINNVISYESPIFSRLQANVLLQTQDTATGAKNGSSASVVYHDEARGLYIALGADSGIDGKAALFANRESDALRLVVSCALSDLTVNALYGTSKKYNGKDGETSYLLGAAYTLDDLVLKAQYSSASVDDETPIAAGGTTGRTSVSLGIDYPLTAKTKTFAFFTDREENRKGIANDIAETVVAVGIDHKF